MKNVITLAEAISDYSRLLKILSNAHKHDLAEYLEHKGFEYLFEKQSKFVEILSNYFNGVEEAELESGNPTAEGLVELFQQILNIFSAMEEHLEVIDRAAMEKFFAPSKDFERFLKVFLAFHLSLKLFLSAQQSNQQNNNIEYVDEFGNPINPSEIDLNNVEFADEDGNPVDKDGNPIEATGEDQFLTDAVSFLQNDDFQGLFTHVCECLNITEDEALKLELNKLRAVALGGLKRHQEARALLLELLESVPDDGFVLANYITSCLACGDAQSACGGIAIYYPDLDGTSKGAVLESVAEAMHVGDLELESLPEEILPDLNQFLKSAKA